MAFFGARHQQQTKKSGDQAPQEQAAQKTALSATFTLDAEIV